MNGAGTAFPFSSRATRRLRLGWWAPFTGSGSGGPVLAKVYRALVAFAEKEQREAAETAAS
jgi:hypothetical protein